MVNKEAAVSFHSVSKSFSGVEVLHKVSFSIGEGKVTALMGENGAGKSTLMKILAGVITEYQGEVFIKGKKPSVANTKEAGESGVAMIHQELNLVPDLSIGENIFLGKEPANRLGIIRFNHLHDESNRLLREFEFPHESRQVVKNIGLGWQQLTEIIKALRGNAKVIIMDEPTSSLTENEKELLFRKIRYLKEQGKTIIYISHRMSEVFEIADEVIIMRDGMYVGQSPINNISRHEIVEMMVGRKIDAGHRAAPVASKTESLRIQNLSVNHHGIPKLKNINFTLTCGEVLGVAGLLGAGRTTLLKFLSGALTGARYSGEIISEGKPYHPTTIRGAMHRHIAYLTEDRKREGIFPNLGIGENASSSVLQKISRAGFINRHKEEIIVTSQLAEIHTNYQSLRQLITRLSGGNQQKVLLSRLLLSEPKLLLLDEPTRGIDVGAKEEIYQLIHRLSNEGFSFIVASSEIHELEQVSHKILVLSSGYQTALLETEKTNSAEVLKYAFEKV